MYERRKVEEGSLVVEKKIYRAKKKFKYAFMQNPLYTFFI